MTNNQTREIRRRMPAEWECDGAVLIAWPHKNTDWAYILKDAQKCFIEMASVISRHQKVIVIAPDITEPQQALRDLTNATFVECDTNDTWTRDYGAIAIEQNGEYAICDFRFNGWGLKFASCFDNLVTSELCKKGIISVERINCQNFVLEGGGIESDGHGTILTTTKCQLSPNRNSALNRNQIESYLCHILGASRILWLNNGGLMGDDTDSHIDTLARFAPNDTIIYVGCENQSDEHYHPLLKMKNELMKMQTEIGNSYNLVELPLPDPIYDETGMRLPATYANYLITPTAIIMPIYGQTNNDLLAKQILNRVYALPVETVDCRTLIRQHGSLHCATMQLPRQILNI